MNVKGLALCVWGMVCLSLVCASGFAQPVKPQQNPAPENSPEEPRSAFPSNPIFILGDGEQDNKSLEPGVVIIPARTFEQMRKQLEELKQSPEKQETIPPRECIMKIQVMDGVAEVTAKFTVITNKPDQVVSLGFEEASVLSADVKEDLFLLPGGTDGYLLQVAKPGTHEITLKLQAPVSPNRVDTVSGGAEKELKLGLPGTPVTRISELILSATVKQVRCNTRLRDRYKATNTTSVWINLPLGNSPTLDLSWLEPASETTNLVQTNASWVIRTDMTPSGVETRAELTLNDLRKKNFSARLIVPAQTKSKQIVTDVKLLSEETMSPKITHNAAAGTVEIKGVPSTSSLKLLVTTLQRGKPDSFSVGPFLYVSKEPQKATLSLFGKEEVLRGKWLKIDRHVELKKVLPETNPETAPEAEYTSPDLARGIRYSLLNKATTSSKFSPFLDVELKTVTSVVQTRINHKIEITRTDAGWKLISKSEIIAKPRRSIEFLEVELPPGLSPEEKTVWALGGAVSTGIPVPLNSALGMLDMESRWPMASPSQYHCDADPPVKTSPYALIGQRKAKIPLYNVPTNQEFIVHLTGTYDVPADVRQVNLGLPRPLTLLTKGGSVVVEPETGLELVDPEALSDLKADVNNRYVGTRNSPPEKIFLSWKQHPPEFPVLSITDLTIQGVQGNVTQQLQFDFGKLPNSAPTTIPNAAQSTIRLQLPRNIFGPQLSQDDNVLNFDLNKNSGVLTTAIDKTQPLVVKYFFSVNSPKENRENVPDEEPLESVEFSVPLLKVSQATRFTNKIRVWNYNRSQISLSPKQAKPEPWQNLGVEVVKNKQALPDLVLQTTRPDLPLRLVLFHSSLSPIAGIRVDKILTRAEVQSGGVDYRCQFLLNTVNTAQLQVEFPEAIGQLESPALTIGSGPNTRRIKVTPSPTNVSGRVAIIPIPDTINLPTVLEVRYRLRPSPDTNVLLPQVLIRPAKLRGNVSVGETETQVIFEDDQAFLTLGPDRSAPVRWDWQNWLFTPQSVSDSSISVNSAASGAMEQVRMNGAVVRTKGPVELRVLSASRGVWLFVCSGTMLTVLLLLNVIFVRRKWIATLLALLLAGGLFAVGVYWPSLLILILYGCQPGFVVLVPLALLQWLLQRRYRRQVVFLPGFTRLQTGSNLIVPGKRNEPSTIDAPEAKMGSLSGNR